MANPTMGECPVTVWKVTLGAGGRRFKSYRPDQLSLQRQPFSKQQLWIPETVASDWPASHLERSENRGRFLPLKDLHGYVVHGNAGHGFAVRGAMVGVAMKNYVSAVTIDHLS